jgi:hypothetical protein
VEVSRVAQPHGARTQRRQRTLAERERRRLDEARQAIESPERSGA